MSHGERWKVEFQVSSLTWDFGEVSGGDLETWKPPMCGVWKTLVDPAWWSELVSKALYSFSHTFLSFSPSSKLRRVPSPSGMLATPFSLDGSTFLPFCESPELTDATGLTFLDVRGLAAFDFLPPFLPDVAFLPLFSGGGERIVSDLPLVPRFLASSSGWILGRTPPLAMVTPFSSWREREGVSSDSKELVGSGFNTVLTVGKTSVKSGLCFPKKLHNTRFNWLSLSHG